MFRRNISWFFCIFVAVVTAGIYSDAGSISASDAEITVYRLRTDNTEPSPTEAVQEVKETAALDLGDLLDAGDGAVVTLVAGETRLVAHRAVLAARSPVLAAMLGGGGPGAGNGEVAIPDVEGPVLRQLLAYAYTLQAPQLPSINPQLLAAAEKYGLSALREACERQMAAQLSVQTAAATAVLAIKNSYTSLKQATIAFIKANVFHVLGTQGWADVLHNHPREMVEVGRLLSESQVETSTTAAAGGGATPTTQPRGQTATSAAPPTGACTSRPLNVTAVSRFRRLSRASKGRMLMDAAEEGATDELETLLAAGADVGARDLNNRTALHWAAESGRLEVVRCLLEQGADVDAVNAEQATPLHLAAREGKVAVVRQLLNFLADPNIRQSDGKTPLHYAAMEGHTGVVRLLVASSAAPNARQNDGWTPLHYATANSHTQVVAVLLGAGANSRARSKQGDVPSDMALELDDQELTDLLL